MPYPQEQQPDKTVSQLQAECEADRLVIVGYDEWISACRLMALREYHQNLEKLKNGGNVHSDTSNHRSGPHGSPSASAARKTQEAKGQRDAYHDKDAKAPLE